MSKLLGHDLGDYLREQRQSAQLSLRQLADLAGISNPYLSQIERGLKRPSAEILQQLARGLQVSAESLYVRAGILDAGTPGLQEACSVRLAVAADPRLSDRQRAILIEVYESFVGASAADADLEAGTRSPADATADVAAAPTTPAGSAHVAVAATPGSTPRRGVRPTPRRRAHPAPATPTAALTTRRPPAPRTPREPEKE
ncbi:MAG: helix-turn-helix transcriptional regulator [Dermatophilaceae bacterium]